MAEMLCSLVGERMVFTMSSAGTVGNPMGRMKLNSCLIPNKKLVPVGVDTGI